MSTLENQPQADAGSLPGETAITERGAGEPFIPLRKAELAEALASDARLSADEAAAFRRHCQLVAGLLHREYHDALEELKSVYAPFDPDADTRTLTSLDEVRKATVREQLFDRFSWLLERANFHRLSQEEIDEAIDQCSHWGLLLKVDFELFDRLEIYYRGDVIGTRYRRRLRNRLRSEAVEVPIYQRLVVIFRLRAGRKFSKYLDTHDVYIKLYKDVPKVDIDMLLPGTQVKISLLDRARIMLPTLSGISIAVWKIVVLATSPLISVLAFLGMVGGTLGYGMRSLFGYLNTKQKYQLNLTQSLYYQKLDSNAGAIHRLLDEAEEQENREVFLGYFQLWRGAPPQGWTSRELDQHVEAFLLAHAEQPVDFEIHDALAKLERLGLAEVTSASAGLTAEQRRWQALPIDAAVAALERRFAELPR